MESLGKQVRDSAGVLDILAEVSFTLEAGRSLAVLGASGSGKSTMLGLLAGLDVPTSGRVIALGQDLFALDEDQRAAWRARHVGFVFQNFQLLPQLSALENAMLGLEISGRPRARERATALLERVGLAQRLQHDVRTLSGGEQQRVALARAFACEPALLFADEPTGSLDSRTGEQVVETLLDLHRETGSTLVLVTHDLALARRCDHRLSLQAGRCVEWV